MRTLPREKEPFFLGARPTSGQTDLHNVVLWEDIFETLTIDGRVS